MHEQVRYEDGPDGVTRSLVPVGELDVGRAGEVRERIEQALAAGKRRVIVDLSETTYMETSALNALLEANARTRQFGATLFVVVPGESQVRMLFSITRLDKVLRVIDNPEEALLAS
jgi:anti-sigma B factor antagonist